ncbi:hypothetical protein JQX13_11095 [Archangium violaceum]|nr:Imm52 family immunity protein [Archangium violaceum]QRK10579.1 hypothetical protein JQX13_11095 [Archangium violaceum]
MLQSPVLARLMHAMAVAFEPEWGIATSHELRERVAPESAEGGTFNGGVPMYSTTAIRPLVY